MTAVQTQVGHQWRVVAPWWHWPQRASSDPGDLGDPDDRRAVRASRPVLQKYATSDPVTDFLGQPQHRLEFDCETDEVWDVSPNGFGKVPSRTRTHRRKLFLTSHHRHYLVVCSIHCDTAGFPHARRDDVCEAGFVVRRRRVDLPGGPRGEAAGAFRRHAVARSRRLDLEFRLRLATPHKLRMAALRRRLEVARESERDAADRLRVWLEELGNVRFLEGWVPAGVDPAGDRQPVPPCTNPTSLEPVRGFGSWQQVEELPAALGESWFPLSPLVPDPTKPEHDATGESIYFGVVPTGSSDLDDQQAPRFGPTDDYEIRCFVRRHRAECPRDGGHCGCPLTWSEATEAYRLADPMDLEGTANRASTVVMPDLAQLHADTMRLSPGGTGGVRFQTPPGSTLSFTSQDTKATQTPALPDAQTCSFAIPLITIVAYFLLKLFLPIVVFVFQLWFLLALRFCIPSSIKIDTGLAGKLDQLGGGLDIDADVVVANQADFDKLLKDLLDGLEPGGPGTKLGSRIVAEHANGDMDHGSFGSLVGAVAARKVTGPKLVFAGRVERSEVVRP
ncbi:hypothetical protein [Terrabacter sp. Root181]|uniref:hypothetical protein n=1 Tax=Terrabacter sp. Root181 TaxID=1736484 RepID=UPI0006F33CF6|nr:hypothetical protein [Terrabacter sp. Root181]KRB43010.1 hypothetical protein ASD90_21725 [Terrabacter sp. Root181]